MHLDFYDFNALYYCILFVHSSHYAYTIITTIKSTEDITLPLKNVSTCKWYITSINNVYSPCEYAKYISH